MIQTLSSHPTVQSTPCSSSNPVMDTQNFYPRQQKQDHVYFDDFIVLKRISQAKFSVYLVTHPQTEQLYAMKVYPREHEKPNFFFHNEIRFSRFQHPNIVSTLGYKDNSTFSREGSAHNLSYIVMEFAPYGDLFDLFMEQKHFFDEKLARTYFHQLIAGLECLHENGVAHLDIKLENLLIGEDYQLKIADFDLSYIEGDEKIHALGSRCYRAPEILYKNCEEGKPADVYSAGIVLFMLQSQGMLPHLEGQEYQGVNLFELLNENPEMFWLKHCEFHREKAELFTEEFRELFIGMTKKNPKERLTVQEIKESRWYNGEIYSDDELVDIMEEMML